MKSAYEIVPLNSVKKYLKKLKDRRLKELFVDLIYSEIAENPYDGIEKKGDLSGIWVRELRYKKTEYRVAYLIEDDEDKKVIPVLLVGTHESFYMELKKCLC